MSIHASAWWRLLLALRGPQNRPATFPLLSVCPGAIRALQATSIRNRYAPESPRNHVNPSSSSCRRLIDASTCPTDVRRTGAQQISPLVCVAEPATVAKSATSTDPCRIAQAMLQACPWGQDRRHTRDRYGEPGNHRRVTGSVTRYRIGNPIRCAPKPPFGDGGVKAKRPREGPFLRCWSVSTVLRLQAVDATTHSLYLRVSTTPCRLRPVFLLRSLRTRQGPGRRNRLQM